MTENYVPPKIKLLGDEYRFHKDTARVMDVIRSEYKSLSSYNTALTRLRAYLISTNEHHEEYEAAIKTLETDLVNEYVEIIRVSPLSTDTAITECIKFLYDFRDVPLTRQLKIVIKLKKGQMSLPRASFVKGIVDIPLLPDYVAALHLSMEEHNKLIQKGHDNQYLLSSNVIVITDPDVILRSCVDLLKHRTSYTPLESFCTALAFLTGRRAVETLLTGRLEYIPGKKHCATFHGQVKTGLQEITSVKDDSPKNFQIPILAPANVVIPSLIDLQMRVLATVGSTVTKEQINQRLSHKLSRAVKSIVHPQMRFHDLRTLYALVSFDAFKPHTFGINGWIKDCLGHSTLKMSTHYTRMQVGYVQRIVNDYSCGGSC